MEVLQLQQYDEWIAEHLDELVAQYAGQVVAIHQGRIAIVGSSEVDVYRKIREAGLEPMPLVFRVPREEDFQSILRVGDLCRLCSATSLSEDVWPQSSQLG